ncbi:MAG: S-methyl-5'-thioinosine phosphorylase [Gammaproteobacteria bacterium]|nr:MAG: S-methyl-5'-thioinosine phosphorylase [Gammaproteobacteria bacterium]
MPSKTPEIAIIGGTGLRRLKGLEITRRMVQKTPYGEPSGPFIVGHYGSREVVFLARHGLRHTIPPHRINYRANIWALKEIGVSKVISVAAVGGISERMAPCTVAIPDQIVDYTWGRGHTFFEEGLSEVVHVDFTEPYSEPLRRALLEAGRRAGIEPVDGGTYATTQGPRLETAAEIDRLERDGCELVGMTGMPEAALARELELEYACCAVVVNRAAGRSEGPITMTMIERNLALGMERVRRLLGEVLGG